MTIDNESGKSGIIPLIIFAAIIISAWAALNGRILARKSLGDFMKEEEYNINGVYYRQRGLKKRDFKVYDRIKGEIRSYKFTKWYLPKWGDLFSFSPKLRIKALIKLNIHEKLWGDVTKYYYIKAKPVSRGFLFKWKVYQFYEKRK